MTLAAPVRFPDRNAASPGEATVDEIYEIVEAFERTISAREIANEVYAEHKDCYAHLFVGGYPADGFGRDLARSWADELDALVRPHGWHVAKCGLDEFMSEAAEPGDEPQTMAFIDVFPLLGAPQAVGTTLWHVSPSSCRESILERGLEPRNGGSDHIVTANGRIYVVLADFVVEYIAEDMIRLRNWDADEIDYWQILADELPEHRWYRDVELEGIGAWTPDPIPSSALRRCDRHGDRLFIPVNDD